MTRRQARPKAVPFMGWGLWSKVAGGYTAVFIGIKPPTDPAVYQHRWHPVSITPLPPRSPARKRKR